MFEYDQEIVQQLLTGNQNFQELYKQHTELKEKVRDAELGVIPLDDQALGTMKKKKLLAKDKNGGYDRRLPPPAPMTSSASL